MENKGCITCRKCEQVRSNFFCGRTRLSQKQLYNKHGFCSDYEPKEQIEKTMTNEEWFNYLSTKEKAEWLDKVAENCCQICDRENRELCRKNIAIGCKFENAKKWEMWLKQPHTPIS